MKRLEIHRKIYFICWPLLAFFIPLFPRLLPPVIILMTLNWVAGGIYLRTIPQFFREKWRLRTVSFALLYLLYLAGMLYTEDYTYGWFDLEVKLSLLLFPAIIATSDPFITTRATLRNLFASYLAGCLVGSLVLLVHAWKFTAASGAPDPFYYTNLAWYFHSSYLSMYYLFGICIALHFIADGFPGRSIYRTAGLALVILYFEALMFLLSSKAGIGTLVIVQGLFIILMISRRSGFIRSGVTVLIFLAAFLAFSMIFPNAISRITRANTAVLSDQAVRKDRDEGTVARMEIWKVSAGLIRQHFMFGVGTGDVKDALMEAYTLQHLDPLLHKKLNAHNQYLQTFITLGISGFCLLVAFLVIPAYFSLRNGAYIYTLFLVIFAINILFESMLETQAGVVFYAMFNALLYSAYRQDPAGNPLKIGPGKV